MPIEPGDRTRAQALGRQSGAARRRLTLEDVERELPPLDSAAHIRENYELVQRWALAGLVPPGTANAIVKAADGALKVLEIAVDLGRLQALERRIKELEREVAEARRAAGRPA